MKLGRFAALESDVPDSPVLDADDLDESGAPVDASNTVEAAAIDAAEVEQPVIEETNEELETLDDSAESLEAYLDFIQETKQNGGMDKNTAKAVKIGLDNALRPLGTNSTDFLGMSQASVESFDGPRRLGQTVSLENAIVEALKSVWEAIKRGVNKLVKYVRDWYLKHLEVAMRTKKRAEKIKEKASNTNGTPKEKKIKVPNLAQLHVSKAVPDASKITSDLELVTSAASSIMDSRSTEAYSNALDKICEEADSIANAKVATQTEYDKVLTEAKAKFDAVKMGDVSILTRQVPGVDTRYSSYTAPGTGKSSISPKDWVKGTAEVIGGKCVAGTVNIVTSTFAAGVNHAEDYHSGEIYRSSKRFFKLIDYSEKKVEVDVDKEGAVLKTSEVSDICNSVIKAMEVIIAYKAAYGKHEKASKDFITKMDKVVKDAKAEDNNNDEKKRVRAIRTLAKSSSNVIKAQNDSVTSFTNYLVSVSRAALNYCNSSLAQYKD